MGQPPSQTVLPQTPSPPLTEVTVPHTPSPQPNSLPTLAHSTCPHTVPMAPLLFIPPAYAFPPPAPAAPLSESHLQNAHWVGGET